MKSKLLNKRHMKDVVKVEIFAHEPQVLADVREALQAGLTPITFDLVGDVLILTLKREKP